VTMIAIATIISISVKPRSLRSSRGVIGTSLS
jgi:hypothetical protein